MPGPALLYTLHMRFAADTRHVKLASFMASLMIYVGLVSTMGVK